MGINKQYEHGNKPRAHRANDKILNPPTNLQSLHSASASHKLTFECDGRRDSEYNTGCRYRVQSNPTG